MMITATTSLLQLFPLKDNLFQIKNINTSRITSYYKRYKVTDKNVILYKDKLQGRVSSFSFVQKSATYSS